jgi:hypothetical protein
LIFAAAKIAVTGRCPQHLADIDADDEHVRYWGCPLMTLSGHRLCKISHRP